MAIKLFCFILFIPTLAMGQQKIKMDFRHGTSGIVFANADTIWFAMDTKVSSATIYHALKIEHTDNIFYSFAGLPKPSLDNKKIYDAYNIMKATIEREKDFFKSFNLFDGAITFELTKFFHFLNKYEPKSFDKYFNEKIHVLEFVIVSFVKETPLVKFRSYTLVGEDRNNSKIISDTTVFNEGHPCVQFIGHADKAYNFLKNNKGYLAKFNNIEDKLVCLIKTQTDAEV